MHITWLDSNSWLMSMGGKQILVDPWLVGPLVFGNLPWLFKSDRLIPRAIPENIDLIVLSQGLEDHTHPPTLKQLDRSIPVVASVNAAKIVRELGYNKVTALAHGESFTLLEQVKIEAKPGSPIGPMLVENGYLFKDLIDGTTLYYEPHGYHSPSLKDAAPIDIVIAPIIDLEIPFLGSIIKGSKSALELVKWLQPQVIMPTAAGGDVSFEGLLISVLRQTGNAEEFRKLLAENNLTTQVIEPKPGESFEIQLRKLA
ncbi:MAG: MBL fold metallo-hydrolase [Cyanomargarita calcarea GSE-NOS-MK-12-04C]|jgi:L-ascorbate metabolism protein UlaG (beta-lactamase superfamily)|uniref:MBL fold metallo-hydrolase n=1 Tax=Cyanomargarita calcarea GSE-NOS-MK-12-04C TaxID=2839659 RepID=A0A951QJD6_9CYAN|nr:MBL fold metallo-hydrolase [Cyanomargarita calcarea GSE-NOS-MK-12-04C]